ncbi:MAG TPA: hypothetical protein ENJ08_00715 [Gammaproteobacteria bacterium]|nr:hypothetical protein [Gammaproteobacteria bacterium]
MIDKIDKNKCLCGVGKSTETCCLPLINGQKDAETPAQLMRSRYSAYAMGNVSYLMQSWHASTRPQGIELDSRLAWTGLTLLGKHKMRDKAWGNETAGKEAYVAFIARFVSEGVAGQMHERSRFVFEQGRWFYVDGQQIESAAGEGSRRPGRNEPCYCGSGKKFKKCCAKPGE